MLTKKAIKLLQQVKEHILAEPQKLDMEVFIEDRGESCGTVACIAGWTTLLTTKLKPHQCDEDLMYSAFSIARKELSLSISQAQRLFYPWVGQSNDDRVETWPKKVWKCYKDGNKEQKAAITAARIDHFIATDGRE